VAPVYFCQERTQAEFLKERRNPCVFRCCIKCRRARTPVAVTGS
jgi:hypothetical protein